MGMIQYNQSSKSAGRQRPSAESGVMAHKLIAFVVFCKDVYGVYKDHLITEDLITALAADRTDCSTAITIE